LKCPFCSFLENKVIDSRVGKDGEVIRRRRECLQCTKRFTTYERVEGILPLVIKKDGRREPFDRDKLLNGMEKACGKRPISVNTLENTISEIEQELQEKSEKEIYSSEIGERVMYKLQELDEIAYVRFASVYRQFKDINQFVNELRDMLNTKEKN